VERSSDEYGDIITVRQPLSPTSAFAPGSSEQWMLCTWRSRCEMKSLVDVIEKMIPSRLITASAMRAPFIAPPPPPPPSRRGPPYWYSWSG
jgi:hypothetical protein